MGSQQKEGVSPARSQEVLRPWPASSQESSFWFTCWVIMWLTNSSTYCSDRLRVVSLVNLVSMVFSLKAQIGSVWDRLTRELAGARNNLAEILFPKSSHVGSRVWDLISKSSKNSVFIFDKLFHRTFFFQLLFTLQFKFLGCPYNTWIRGPYTKIIFENYKENSTFFKWEDVSHFSTGNKQSLSLPSRSEKTSPGDLLMIGQHG